MPYKKDAEAVVVREGFTIALYQDSFDIAVDGRHFFTLSPISAVFTEKDEDSEVPDALRFDFSCEDGVYLARWTSKSKLWERKEYLLRIEKEAFHYSVRVWGSGTPRHIDYFCGALLAGKPGILYHTSEYLYPQPRLGTETYYYSMAEDCKIFMQLMVPPPLCLPFRTEEKAGWFGIGLCARAGRYNFDGFSYRNVNARARFSVEVYGEKTENGEWTSPGILGCPGGDEWQVLRSWAAWHYRNGCRGTEQAPARWWHGPLFCGWGEQAILKWKYHTDIFEAASQAAYTEMSEHLDGLGLHPSAIIIDDKWQKEYGTFLPDSDKWPDFAGFVRREHGKGRRVLLWYRCWSPEGLPAEECILKDGVPVAGDPTNPRYIERVRETVRILLSEEDGGFGCDGFKLDFADRVPVGEGLAAYESGVYGIELVKRLMALIYDAAKSVKPDALISASGCHPYFADVTDMARLHDYDMRQRCVVESMSWRAKLYRIMLPDALIDTDFPAFSGREESMKYLRFAPALGVPDLYRLSDTDECLLSDGDWAEVRSVWDAYTEKIRTEFHGE